MKISSKIFRIALICSLTLAAFLFLATNENLKPVLNQANAQPSSDCHYVNGWKSFTDDKGGGYDCCNQWRELEPKSRDGNCQPATPPTNPPD